MRTQFDPFVLRRGGVWSSAYRIATINSAVFLLFSFVNSAFSGMPLAAHFTAASLFMFGAIFSFYKLSKESGGFSAISFYVLGAGITFGFGTAYSVYAQNDVYDLLFTESDKLRNLPTINLINSLSVMLVLISAWPFCRVPERSGSRLTLIEVFNKLQSFHLLLLIASACILLMGYLAFPVAENLLVRSMLDKLRMLPLLAFVLSFSKWRSLSPALKLTTVFLVILATLLGFLSASKFAVLLPILGIIGGLYLGNYRKSSIAFLVVTVAAYFILIAPIVNQMRAQPQYNMETNTPLQRLEIIGGLLTTDNTLAIEDREANWFQDLVRRFVLAHDQSYLIDEWRDGRPGDSLTDFWDALVPRILWPEKPIVTRFGSELFENIYSQTSEGSSEAPTYTAEAYWNYGWSGVVIVSIILGIELGWFTRKWLQFIYRHNLQLGILFFCIPVAAMAVYVETWITNTYVGGFVTLFICIKGIDLISPIFNKTKSEYSRAVGIS